jgi:hypothetical protein
MKKLTLIFLLINFYIAAYNQVIRGTVFDKETKSPVGFAYLYFNGTFTVTQSDQNGNYELDVSKNASMPLTISAIGYYSSTLTDFSTEKPNLIYLIPKLYELKEITINAKSLARRRKANLILFKNAFLGTTSNARNCKILNETDITFNYNSDKDTLKAFALKPILIDNRALGYSIAYYLDKFAYVKRGRAFFFQGNITFNEDLNKDAAQKEVFEMRRKYAYFGSRMHFFRSLWLDDLRSAGFAIKNSSNENLTYKDIVIEDVSKGKFLKYSESLGICYNSKEPLSKLVFLKDKIFFSNDGYFDSLGVSWEGYMASLRIGDWLPYEYLFK